MIVLEENKDIFYLAMNNEAVCVTTNGQVNKNGEAVMGKGIALEAKNLFHCEKLLGQYIKTYGNRAFNLGRYQRDNQIFTLFSFPTKRHWKDCSDITLIVHSAEQLVEMCDKFNITKCYLPLVGCGAGELNWDVTVYPWLSEILDDRFVVVKWHH